MRAWIIQLLPVVRELLKKTQNNYDDKAWELVEIVVRSDAAWEWFQRLLNGQQVIYGASDGDDFNAFPAFADCPCPPEVQKFLTEVAVEKEGYGSVEDANYGSGIGTILLAIQIVRQIIAFINSLQRETV